MLLVSRETLLQNREGMQ